MTLSRGKFSNIMLINKCNKLLFITIFFITQHEVIWYRYIVYGVCAEIEHLLKCTTAIADC